MRILFFDTETTGLPKNYKAPVSDSDNWPRIIQMAWMVTDENGTVVDQYKSLIKPDGWKVPEDKFWKDNGHSNEKNEAEGVPIALVLGAFQSDCKMSDVVVAHNLEFDKAITGAEMYRLRSMSFPEKREMCTKLLSTSYCRIPAKFGSGYKWPNLTELHTKLFGKAFDSAHDAMGDVAACKDCFFELKKRNVISI